MFYKIKTDLMGDRLTYDWKSKVRSYVARTDLLLTGVFGFASAASEVCHNRAWFCKFGAAFLLNVIYCPIIRWFEQKNLRKRFSNTALRMRVINQNPDRDAPSTRHRYALVANSLCRHYQRHIIVKAIPIIAGTVLSVKLGATLQTAAGLQVVWLPGLVRDGGGWWRWRHVVKGMWCIESNHRSSRAIRRVSSPTI